MKKNGFSLIEVLLSLSILGGVTAAGLSTLNENIEKNKSTTFVKKINDIVNAVDARIAIDGYDPDLWNKLSWINESEINDDLINKELNSSSSKCSGGTWNPSIISEQKTILLPCLFSTDAGKMDIDLRAKINNDSSGFIQNFEVVFFFKSEEAFTKNLRNIRAAMREIDSSEKRENTGSHNMSIVSRTDSDQEITSFDCINNIANCAFKASYDRSGGNEYLRADGGNSLINDHLTFIETKGDSPLKCIRWANTDRSGTGNWTQQLDEDCGVGIYRNDPYPVMVDVVADTGTFKNILLDKDCKIYSWNGSSVIDSGSTSPCGINATSGNIYQVVENISSKQIESSILYSETANFLIANIKDIIADTIKADRISAVTEFKTDLIKSYSVANNIVLDSNVTINEILNAKNNVNISGDLYTVGNAYVEGDITSLNSLISIKALELKEINIENSSCSVNGSLSITSNGSLLNCVSGLWNSAIKDSTPVGTVAMWSTTSIPSGWIEMNGQSTAPYPKLRSIVGNNVSDLRGVFVRGWDHGRGIDTGRGLQTYQADEFKSHNHAMDFWVARGNGGGLPAGYRDVAGSFQRNSRDTGGSETRPKNISLMYIIKAS